MRLDKFIANNTALSRKDVQKEIKQGNVTVDGEKATSAEQKIDENIARVCLNGKQISYVKYVYFMLNKPQGVVSATNDTKQKTVLDLLPPIYKKMGLFPCGRLDKDTLGLVILTNNGQGAHVLLAPKNHVQKTYEYKCADPLCVNHKQQIEQGIELKDGYITKPCKISMQTPTHGTITIFEGKYHEIKRMFGAVGNKITYLKRISFGSITLDPNLNDGEYRPLTAKEQKLFEQAVK